MDRVNINDIQLAYERRGKGQPLVLLHGYPLDHHIWDEILPFVLFAYNTSIQDTTRYSPFFLLHGREPTTYWK